MKTVVVTCSRYDGADSLIIKSKSERWGERAVFDHTTNNTNGLPVIYNRAIDKYSDSDTEWLVFVHDDVYIDDAFFIEKLNSTRKKFGFDIIGLAGGVNPTITQYNLWHWMCSRENQRGSVSHPCNDHQTMTTCFGPSPSRVAIADGLFLAAHLKSIKRVKWRFNENYTFHHYDISSCIDANNLKLKIGVAPINVIHASPGLVKGVSDPVWAASNQQFISEYTKSRK